MVMEKSRLTTETFDTEAFDRENALKQMHESIELMLMGWTRTSITLIGFGLAIGEAFSLVRSSGPRNAPGTPRLYLITAVAIGLIILGVFGLLVAVIHSGWSLMRLKQGDINKYEKPWYLSVIVAVLLMCIGLVALMAMILP
jgi:putative membrane protein